jgi:hypothetical protein
MLAYQKKIYPFTPSMRDLLHEWGLSSAGQISGILSTMFDQGMVLRRDISDNEKPRYIYYAIEKKEDVS